MNEKVFISGSISIKKLSVEVKKSIDKIIENSINILVGDADGIDTLIQDYCISLKYYNVTVYTISKFPRYIAGNEFDNKYIAVSSAIKKERTRQQEKDKAMTIDSDYTFVIWDSKSKGSYANILRAIETNKKIKIYLSDANLFVNKSKITKEEIEFIYRESNGYTASEVVEYLKNEAEEIFQKTQDLNKYLLEHLIIKKDSNIYTPIQKYEHLFIIDMYRGKIKGIKFKNEFIGWIENHIKENQLPEQGSLF